MRECSYNKAIDVLEYAGRGFNAVSLKYMAIINDDGILLRQTLLHEKEIDELCDQHYLTRYDM